MTESLSYYSGKRVLVTGGLGFIGSNLVRKLAKCPQVSLAVLDSLEEGTGGNRHNLADLERPIEVFNIDQSNREKINALVPGFDVIFNLTGQISHVDSMQFPFEDQRCNYLAHLSLLEACRYHNPKAKIIFASTRQIYGRPRYLPVDEKHPCAPVDVNGIDKLAGEQMHLLYHRVYGTPAVVLRLTNTYGPRQLVKHARQGFIGWFIRQAIDGEVIQLFGDGSNLRGLAFVDDVVEAFLLAGADNNLAGKIFNLGSPEVHSLLTIVEKLLAITGRGSYKLVPFPPDRLSIDIGPFTTDYSAFTAATGWTPRVHLKEGLKQTVEFYESNREWYWG